MFSIAGKVHDSRWLSTGQIVDATKEEAVVRCGRIAAPAQFRVNDMAGTQPGHEGVIEPKSAPQRTTPPESTMRLGIASRSHLLDVGA
jgi:hypothetical protein